MMTESEKTEYTGLAAAVGRLTMALQQVEGERDAYGEQVRILGARIAELEAKIAEGPVGGNAKEAPKKGPKGRSVKEAQAEVTELRKAAEGSDKAASA
jgi:hypothetical protein